MGKGRAPCCDKSQVKKGPWSPAEDLRLITFIQKHGHENWRALPKQAGLLRCGKSCRLRWINYLRPDVKRGNFSKEEEDSIIKLHQTLGNKWSKIASHLPGRTDNEIKNVWNTHLKKRLTFKEQDSTGGGDESKESSTTSSSSSSSSITIMQTKRRNVESEVDHHHHYRQWKSDHDGSVNKKPRVAEQEAKEMPTSSASSNNSNITNYNNKPEDDQPDYLLDHFSPPYDVHNVLEEVNKPEIQETAAADQAVVDIPFESDLDFWNMLDGLNSSIPMDNNNSNSIDKISSCHSSSLGEVENRKWLRYLENELGLEATKDGSHESTSLSEDDAAKPIAVTENFHYEIPVKPPEVNSGMGYYHLWPSVA